MKAPFTDQDENGASTAEHGASVGRDAESAKQFSTLQARFAMRGHCLRKITAQSGESTYFAEKWGLVRWLDDLDAAEAFLTQIGG